MANVIDRKLLELAAKAVGNGAQWDCPDRGMMVLTPDGCDTTTWNPLADDGDAFRVVALLGLWVTYKNVEVQVRHFAGHYLDGPTYIIERRDSPNPYAATRRAIVRAAAEIGKVMP